eukprot:CAMPEP_0174235926 /NCGR_PEP_ID=MMETSP0417-20130205/5183_1 /TAXON_ID=242541 /ORGANISM="Mayorella sp, Strain BSH-02190019" /LENGTH=150 /DNA_ID=CAMNT_0015314503 /DNA_START=45 /DNA_END=497 /DNA_ORIENTATION=-
MSAQSSRSVVPHHSSFFHPHWPLAPFFDRSAFEMDSRDWHPSVDVQRDETGVTITADLPGVKQEDIKVAVSNGTLNISGKREEKIKEESEDGSRVYTERWSGSFQRRFPLPDGVVNKDIQASLQDGVLKVRVPLQPAGAAEHQVPITKSE